MTSKIKSPVFPEPTDSLLKKLIESIQQVRPDLAQDGHLDIHGIQQALRHTYGLSWEPQPEHDVDKKERQGLHPLLTYNKEKSYFCGENAPVQTLIKGDNYHALKVLNYTHPRKIDFIYIDPPYNRGKKDFVYNDNYVAEDDIFKHSKWLSFMEKRLQLAKNLLKETGVIFISIDDNEQAQLKMLCDSIFKPKNFIATVPVITNLKGNQSEFGFAGTHEYLLCYAKNKGKALLHDFPIDDEEQESWQVDQYGPFKQGAALKASGADGAREKRETMYFPIYISKDDNISLTRMSPTDEEVFPNTGSKEFRWRWGKKKFIDEPHNVIVGGEPGKRVLYKKQRPEIGDLPSKKPKSFLYKPAYSTGAATNELKEMFDGERIFDSPKALTFMCDLIQIACPVGGLVLDFFAGSGTTGHATMQLNASLSNEKKRRCILITDDEGEFKGPDGNILTGGICTNVTQPRLIKAISGYGNGKNQYGGLGENLAVFETSMYAPKIDEYGQYIEYKKFLTEAIDLLRLKENTFEDVPLEKISSPDVARVYKSTLDNKYLVVILDENIVEACIEALAPITDEIALYPFTYDDDNFAQELCRNTPNIKVIPVPENLLRTYRRLNRNKP